MTMQRAFLAAVAGALVLTVPVQAASSTSKGQISITQVVQLIEQSSQDNAARNAAMAYLAGVGEATGLLVAESARRPSGVSCQSALSISSESALAAVSRTARGKWSETAATPILVEDMLDRAGCR